MRIYYVYTMSRIPEAPKTSYTRLQVDLYNVTCRRRRRRCDFGARRTFLPIRGRGRDTEKK